MDAVTTERLRLFSKAVPLFRVGLVILALTFLVQIFVVLLRSSRIFEIEVGHPLVVLRVVTTIVLFAGFLLSALVGVRTWKKVWSKKLSVLYLLFLPTATVIALTLVYSASFVLVPYHRSDTNVQRVLSNGTILRYGIVWRGIEKVESVPLPLRQRLEFALIGWTEEPQWITADVILREGEPLQRLVDSITISRPLDDFTTSLKDALSQVVWKLTLDEYFRQSKYEFNQSNYTFDPEHELVQSITIVTRS